MKEVKKKGYLSEKETNVLGLFVCQYELENANAGPPFALPVVGAWVQLLQGIEGFSCIVELAHLKQQGVMMATYSYTVKTN